MPGLLLKSRGSASPSPSTSPTRQPMHRRTAFSRRSTSTSSGSPTPPRMQSMGLPVSLVDLENLAPGKGESDEECWRRMLELQREYHCYNSARLEAAVEAMERGWTGAESLIPSRLCLDLLNDELKQHIAASQELLSHEQWGSGYPN